MKRDQKWKDFESAFTDFKSGRLRAIYFYHDQIQKAFDVLADLAPELKYEQSGKFRLVREAVNLLGQRAAEYAEGEVTLSDIKATIAETIRDELRREKEMSDRERPILTGKEGPQ